jgi:hypothetical protein
LYGQVKHKTIWHVSAALRVSVQKKCFFLDSSSFSHVGILGYTLLGHARKVTTNLCTMEAVRKQEKGLERPEMGLEQFTFARGITLPVCMGNDP